MDSDARHFVILHLSGAGIAPVDYLPGTARQVIHVYRISDVERFLDDHSLRADCPCGRTLPNSTTSAALLTLREPPVPPVTVLPVRVGKPAAIARIRAAGFCEECATTCAAGQAHGFELASPVCESCQGRKVPTRGLTPRAAYRSQVWASKPYSDD